MEFHDYTKFFPLMEGNEFTQLVADIKEQGLIEPIVTYQGKILDGRNRFRACVAAGVKPWYELYKGKTPLVYVISKNIFRRHMSYSQKAVAALDIEKEFAEEAKHRETNRKGKRSGSGQFRHGGPGTPLGKSAERAAKVVGVSESTVKRIKRIEKDHPEFIFEIRSGKFTVGNAYQEIFRRRAEASSKRHTEKKEKQKRQERTTEVKDYLNAIKIFREAIEAFYTATKTAIRVVDWGSFSPESKRFTKTKHNQLREILEQVDFKMIKPVEAAFTTKNPKWEKGDG